MSGIPASKEKMQITQEKSQKDSLICGAIELTLEGWPNVYKVPPGELYHVCGKLSVVENMCKRMLMRTHKGHMGITKSRLRAQDVIWWPGISNDVKTNVEKCHYCQINKLAQKAEPLKSKPLTERPWQNICRDILEYRGRHYLAVVDEYSLWLEILQKKNMSSNVVALELKQLFA